jgi:formamidopyrimidine-DNA glycosylase
VSGGLIVSAHFLRPQTVQHITPTRLAKRLQGQAIRRVWRRAKNILLDLGSGDRLRIHLRMTGNLYAWPEIPPPRPSMRAWFGLDSGAAIVFDDPRALGRIDLLEPPDFHLFDASLGIEPLMANFTTRSLAELLSGVRAPVKLFLLDQTKVCGLGNIWAAESLHLARIHPERPAGSLEHTEIRSLRGAVRTILSRAVKSAYRSYSKPGATPESEGFGVRVYGRAGMPCRRCGAVVARIRQGGRSTYFCPGCQVAAGAGASAR